MSLTFLETPSYLSTDNCYKTFSKIKFFRVQFTDYNMVNDVGIFWASIESTAAQPMCVTSPNCCCCELQGCDVWCDGCDNCDNCDTGLTRESHGSQTGASVPHWHGQTSFCQNFKWKDGPTICTNMYINWYSWGFNAIKYVKFKF